MALSNKERVGRMLDTLALGLRPVVEEEFTKVYSTNWLGRVADEREMKTGMSGPADANDPQFLLNAIWFHWRETLGKSLGNAEKNYVAELRDVRNRWAHQAGPWSLDDLYRAFDTAERLLRAVAAPQADQLMKAKVAALNEGFEAARRSAQKSAAATAVSAEPAKGLPSWRSIVTPHPDVAEGRFRQAEFAADLAAVARGEGAKEYVDPREFFSRTFLTEGLRALLVDSLRRLAGTGGESVVELQTTFGGGKTHSMLALWHLADPSVDVATLPGLEPVLAQADVRRPTKVARAALVGTTLSPITSRVHDGTEVRTMWGELAWQLGGPSAFATFAEADRRGIPPGGDALRALLAAHAPAVILIDEWVTYARLQWGKDDLPGGSFEATLSFAQQLTQAVDQVPGALLVVSLPSSAVEVGGEAGQQALASLKQVVQRMNAPWRPAAAQESFEIVRRRLFEPLPIEGVKGRDEVVQRFSELYAQHQGSFPVGTKDKAYLDRMRACYPIHPELFDRLFDDWSTLERFQQTRGVLKLMAAVIQALWERNDPNLMILPASVPLDDTAVLPQLTQYLDAGWPAVIASDVDGETSLPLRLDGENPAYGRYSAARRVARTVFLGSAPLPAAANRGIDDRRILLGSVQPGETPATFGDALRKLAGQATYLYEQGGRYWYSTQPSINQLARDRAARVSADRVEMEIEKRLKAMAGREPFARVHVAPRGGADVPDEDEVALVVLGPERAHDAKAAVSPASSFALEVLGSRGAGARTNQNMLIFAAPDVTRLEELTSAVRNFLAWASIREDGEAERLDLSAADRAQVKSQERSAGDTINARVPETYIWLLVPEQTDPLAKVSLRQVKVSPGSDPLAMRVGAKLRNDGLLITKYGGANLRLVLDQVLRDYWTEHREVGLRDLWGWFAAYPYMPRLRDRSVLEGAVEDGIRSLQWRTETFAYAAARDTAGEYRGLIAAKAVEAPVTATSLIVDGSVVPDPAPWEMHEPSKPPPPPVAPTARATRRFHGEVVLPDGRRPTPDFIKIVDEVIDRLAQQTDVRLRVTIEVDAEHAAEAGFTDDTIRTISENAKTLRFRDFRWEKD